MSKLKDLANAAIHSVYESDAPATPAPAPVHAHPAFNLSPNFSAAATAPALTTPGGSPFAVPSTTVLDEKVYQNVLGKTNFDTTPVGKTIHKYFDALDGVIPDTTQRFKAAIGQAQKLDGITPDQVLSTFDAMQAALDKDATGFQGVASSVEAQQITARQTKITDLQTQVSNLNSQIAQLSGELVDQQTTHANAVSQYALAQQRRAQEIAAQKAQFVSMLR